MKSTQEMNVDDDFVLFFQEKFFPTDNQLVAELERLEEMPAETLTKEATLEMEVTEMNENKLAMKVKVRGDNLKHLCYKDFPA